MSIHQYSKRKTQILWNFQNQKPHRSNAIVLCVLTCFYFSFNGFTGKKKLPTEVCTWNLFFFVNKTAFFHKQKCYISKHKKRRISIFENISDLAVCLITCELFSIEFLLMIELKCNQMKSDMISISLLGALPVFMSNQSESVIF